MAVPFDHIAPTYDPVFAQSTIGQMQRKQVWQYVEKVIAELQGFEMLELNHGTGEDSVLFGDRGFNLVATDIGAEMLKITEKKAARFSMQHQISSHYIDLESFNETLFDKRFDLVFSNFGGMNGVNPESLKKLLHRMPAILNPGGRFIGVMMPKFCAWETVFFLLRLQFKKAFRRLTSKEVIPDFADANMKTWFYQPSQLKKWSREKFKIVTLKPVGIALPPTYLEKFISLKQHWLLRLGKLEKKINSASLFSGMADNYIIDLQLK